MSSRQSPRTAAPAPDVPAAGDEARRRRSPRPPPSNSQTLRTALWNASSKTLWIPGARLWIDAPIAPPGKPRLTFAVES